MQITLTDLKVSTRRLVVFARQALVMMSIVAIGLAQSTSTSTQRTKTAMNTPRLKNLAPVLIVDSVEPCLRFWEERFGFKPANQVPGPDGKLIFASVEKDGVEVMYQTRASVVAENPKAAEELNGHSVALFITVEDIDTVEKAVAGAPVVKARHTTFYGSIELYVREP